MIFIGTNEYSNLFPIWKNSVDNFFLNDCEKTIFAFTDRPTENYFKDQNVVVKQVDHLNWPFITLFRFKMMNAISNELSNFDYIFFLDADLFPKSDITLDEVVSKGKDLVGVQHPGNYKWLKTRTNPEWDPLDRTPGSTASVGDLKISDFGTEFYHQGCFWGGESSSILDMVAKLDNNVDLDLSNNIVASWHDESHMNRYFWDNISRVNTLSPLYAIPEDGDWKYTLFKGMTCKMLHASKSEIKKLLPQFKGGTPG